jgi:CheY-like chemotaxis protein
MQSLAVLICDDEPSIGALLEELLTRFGHRVNTCQDGESALLFASGHAFDLAFLDLRMPGMGGEELLKRLRASRPEAIYVMITGYARDDVVDEALRNGASACLCKPFSLSQVIRLLEQVASGQMIAA